MLLFKSRAVFSIEIFKYRGVFSFVNLEFKL